MVTQLIAKLFSKVIYRLSIWILFAALMGIIGGSLVTGIYGVYSALNGYPVSFVANLCIIVPIAFAVSLLSSIRYLYTGDSYWDEDAMREQHHV